MDDQDKMDSAQYSEGYEEGLSIGLERGETTGYEARNEEVELLENTLELVEACRDVLEIELEKLREKITSLWIAS